MQFDISLIIPSYKREELLVQTLQCALKQDFPSYEVILVDQTPDHKSETLDYLNSIKDKIKTIHPTRASVTHARNLGVKAASGKVIVFIDDDTSFGEKFLSAHWEAHKDKYSIVQGRVMEEGSRVAKKPVWLNRIGNYSGSDTCATDGVTNNITGCNCSFKRELYDVVGGFDEFFRGIAVGEDSDFAYRAYKKGYLTKFSVKAELFHHKSKTGGVAHGISNENFDLGYYRNKLYFYGKHFNALVFFYQWARLLMKGLRRFTRMHVLATKQARKMHHGEITF